MMLTLEHTEPSTGRERIGDDVTALAWVEGELRRTVELAHKALRRFVKEQSTLGGSDVDAVDPAVLRTARSHLHQAVGALELVGQPSAAAVLRAAEAAVQRMATRPRTAAASAAETVERASFAVLDYIARIIAGKPVGATAMYPQYAAVQALAGVDRVHPADLWPHDWQWRTLPDDPSAAARTPDDELRSEMETLVLTLMRQPTADAQRQMGDLCAGLGAGAEGHARAVWMLAAALFEGQAAGLVPADVHTKRLASRLMSMLRASMKGETGAPDGLGRELLFFCLRAPLDGAPVGALPRLSAVQRVWPPDDGVRTAYDEARLGRFDPAIVQQARKRVATARESWAAVAAGEAPRSGSVGEAMALLADSLDRLFPRGQPLGRAMQAAAQAGATASPSPALAMEVATGILYLEAVLEDGELDDPSLPERVARLAERVNRVADGAEPQPLEPWMEDLYRRVSDRQTMGSVVQELRGSLSEVERHIDAYFRDPGQAASLMHVPAQMQAMRGVLSVLGIDAAAQAVVRMRDEVATLARAAAGGDAGARTDEICHRLADNLGALGFLIDMLAVQPSAAKSLFTFDADSGRLRSSMGHGGEEPGRGRAAATTEAVDARSTPVPVAAPAVAPAAPATPTPVPVAAPVPSSGLEDDAEMREVFLEEAGEVLEEARGALARLGANPGDVAEMTAIRRAFHTLKGSSRMVGLAAFGDAAWACERLYNTRLAEQAMMDGALGAFTAEALDTLARWVDTIAGAQPQPHDAARLGPAADALRTGMPLAAAGAPDGADIGAIAAITEDLPAADTAEDVVSDVAADVPADVPDEAVAGAVVEAVVEMPALGGDEATATVAADDDTIDEGVQAVKDGLEAWTVDEPAPAAGRPAGPPPAAFTTLQARVPDLPTADDLDLAALPTGDIGPAPAHEPMPSAADAVGNLGFELDLGALDEAEPAPALTLRVDSGPAARRGPSTPDATAGQTRERDADGEAGPGDLALPDALEFGAFGVEAPTTGDDRVPEPQVLEDADLQALFGFELAGDAEPAPPAAPTGDGAPLVLLDPVAEMPEPGPLAASRLEAEAEAEAEPHRPAVEAEAGDADLDEAEQVKVVGPLRIAIPLFNIFLNEADEQSRRLGTELAEWTHEPQRPVGETAIALAHSLAGNSGTVGFAELSALARQLEHALMRSEEVGRAREGEAALFNDAADEIRRLLHQFAAGFLRPVSPELLQRFADHERWPVPAERPSDEAGIDAPGAPHAPDEAEAPHAAGAPGPADGDDTAGVADAIDADLFPIFDEEAEELLPQLHARLAEWVRHPGDRSAPAAAMRTLHTFKGGARLAGAMRLGEMAHRLESGIERLTGGDAPAAAEIERLLAYADAMGTAIEVLRHPPSVEAPAQTAGPDGPADDAAPHDTAQPVAEAPPPSPLPEAAGDLGADEPGPADRAGIEPAALPDAAPALRGPAVPPPADAVAPPPADAMAAIDWSRFPAADVDAAPPEPAGEPAAAAGAVGTVRVRATLLDRLVGEAGEVIITRARLEADMRTLQSSLEDLTENLDRLRSQLRDIELQAETQISSRLEAAKAAAQAFDPLEMDRFTRFQELTRMMAESVNDVATVQRTLQRTLQSSEDELAAQARLTRALQDDLLRTRMVEFESLADRLYRVVRLAAKETGKAVRMDLIGGGIEIDRGVLERMVGPFEHLLRNCVAHGIEPAERRRAAGKPETGSVTVTVVQEGNEVAVEVRDDGAGLDLALIRERAVARGLLAADADPGPGALAQMIFAPGFSTAETVSGLAGRGIGMDVVRAEVQAMGGRIETRSDTGQGTTFRLLLPLTTAVTQVVMLRFGNAQIALPSTLVEVVRRGSAEQVDAAYDSGQWTEGEDRIPFFWLGALLQADARGDATQGSQTVVIVRSAAQRVAVHVDEVVGQQEVVVKNLGPQLSRLPGLAGITLLPSGAVATIYNPVALASVYGEEAHRRMRVGAAAPADGAAPADITEAPADAEPVQAPLVMVVDDSLTVRRVTQRLLLREGYRVLLAKDGMDAIEKLAGERPAVMLSDIEMPRMDGFDLVRNLRADERLRDLPVIMITSRIAQKHRDVAAGLGVEHYLGKPYSEDELLALVARHAGADIEV